MKIRKLQLKNIGVFDDETIEFQPCPAKDKAEIHIFTGQNGSGKSTILMALANIFDVSHFQEFEDKPNLASQSLNLYRNDFYKRLRNCDCEISFKVQDSQIEKTYRFHFFRNPWQFVYKNYLNFTDPIIKKLHHYAKTVNSKITVEKFSTDFAVFAVSGYRQIFSTRVEAIKESADFNPLWQSLDFVKDYSETNQLTINQLIANNISKSAIEKGRNDEKSKKFANIIKSIELVISEITGWKVEFELETEPTNLITKINGEELDFDVLPDGLRSLISWIADLLGRVDLLKWQDDLPIFEKNLILLLDEIEVHLHPAWQRKVLPVVQKLFKNSQIFVSTHSPFVVNSVDDAWVYILELDGGKAKVVSVERSEDALSYRYVLRNTFGIENEFGIEIEKRLNDFYKERDAILAENGNSKKAKAELKKIAKELSKQSKELKTKIDFELFQLSEITGEDF